MTQWFTPTAENYFSRVGKNQIVEAINDVGGTLPGASMKKNRYREMAELTVAGKGWLRGCYGGVQ